MTVTTQNAPLPANFHMLEEASEGRPNRLCVCLSDLHFTDGTVGNQSAEAVVWQEVFDNIVDMCKDKAIKELNIILVGDVADMIRTAQWAKNNVYPWQREHPRFKEILRDIMTGIINEHAKKETGFFYLLQQLPQQFSEITSCVIKTQALLGNHDKEIFADDVTLQMFYEDCLGQPVKTLSKAYRSWIGKMYFNDENYYADVNSVPRLPFYWGDTGFRLFVTHGQWRDEDNSRRIDAQQDKKGWQVTDGWQLDVWQALDFAPFTQACFGDTVAAGVLSGFIYHAKVALDKLKNTNITPQAQDEISRLEKILDELDLYRPTYAAVQRIIEETWRLRQKSLPNIGTIIEKELLDSIHRWLAWDFTLESTTPARRSVLKIARPIVKVLKALGAGVELGFIYAVMWLLTKLKQGFFHTDAPSYKEMLTFPGFLSEYRQYGFRIHGEGHTHIPLQAELSFDQPGNRPNYTYINFGTWRDQIVLKQENGYRRRGFGRVLSIIDFSATSHDAERYFAYWVEDVIHWGDRLDKL